MNALATGHYRPRPDVTLLVWSSGTGASCGTRTTSCKSRWLAWVNGDLGWALLGEKRPMGWGISPDKADIASSQAPPVAAVKLGFSPSPCVEKPGSVSSAVDLAQSIVVSSTVFGGQWLLKAWKRPASNIASSQRRGR